MKTAPSAAQIKAGNYPMQHRTFRGLRLSIENRAGSVRSGTTPDGHRWRTKMVYDYGYIRGSQGVDGDHVDCYVGPDEDAPMVYVIHQRKAGRWLEFDEDKVMFGFGSLGEACNAYLLHYDDSRFLGPVTVIPFDEFRGKVLATAKAPAMIKALAALQALSKAHISGYTRNDGVFVSPHEDSRSSDPVAHPAAVETIQAAKDHWLTTVRAFQEMDAHPEVADPDAYFDLIGVMQDAEDALVARLVAQPDDGFALHGTTSDGRLIMLNSSAKVPGEWQITRFASDGLPVSDSQHKTKSGAVSEFLLGIVATSLRDMDGLITKALPVRRALAALQALAGLPVERPISALIKALAANEHWITVHPNGPGTTGTPLLIQDHPDGSARVIGGAGGSLNYLKLRGLKSGAEYRQDAAARASEKRAARKLQTQQDKEHGLHDAKVGAREAVLAQRKAGEAEFVKVVADAMGWGPEEMEFKPTAGMSEAGEKAARARHDRDLLKRAKAAAGLQQRSLVADADARAAAGIGEVPLDAQADALSVEDLDPVRIPNGSGISHAFKDRAEKAGLNDEAKSAEVSAIKAADQKSAPDPDKVAEKKALAEKVHEELGAVARPDLKPKIAEAKVAVAMLLAKKKMLALQAQARKANKEIDNSHVEPKAYVLTAETPDVDSVAKDVQDDLRTIQTRAFLATAAKHDVEAHIASGAYNAMNAVAQACGGGSMMDRSVVEVLGVAGASLVLARRLHGDLGKEKAAEISKAVEDYHIDHYGKLANAAMDEAEELQQVADQIKLEQAVNGHDLLEAVELQRQRKQALADASQAIGLALGEMEAGGALVMAMKSGPAEKFEVSLGKTALDSAVQQLRAIGLLPGDYEINRIEGNVFVTVKASGMDRLSSAVDQENLERVSRNLSIQRGDQDEDNWLPAGFADRPDLALNLPAGVAPSLAEPMSFSGPDLAQSLRDYIGGRAADGDRAADILADIQSADFFTKSGNVKAYRDALDVVAPNKDADGKKRKRAEELQQAFDAYAEDFVSKRWGGERSTLNSQSVDADETSQDALHRALSEHPVGKVAYKNIADLTPQDQRAMRDFFAENVARESPQQAELRAHCSDIENQEPENESVDMFGETTINPSWSAWRSSMDEAIGNLKASGLDWPGYVHMLRSPAKAYAAMQDLIRSRVSESFAKHYNTLKPDAPIKIGRTVVRGNLNHLDAVDPEARAARIAKEKALIDALRERHAGKYASGSVSDKLDAAKEQQAAFEQSQMGFFSSDDMFGGGGSDSAPVEKPLAADERHTLGHVAERKIAEMMQVVGPQFEPGKPVKIFQPTMSGKDGVKRQRAIKLVRENKRVILGAGVGSGKTAMGLGAFADLHSTGKVKKGLFLVPSIVQGQFGAEALRFLKPGQFSWHCQPGGSRDDRIKAYQDAGTDFHVVTHQSFRDDLVHLAAAHDGSDTAAVVSKLAVMTGKERADYTKAVLEHHGINFDYVMADEAHNLLDREGKEDSGMSRAIQGLTDNVPYYVSASGDPVKNDVSEAFSSLNKMDPVRYNDPAAFKRRYGGDTKAAKDGLQRELARHLYAMSIRPDVQKTESTVSLPLTAGQKTAINEVDKLAARVRLARMKGGSDIEAARALSPAMFAGLPDDQHKAASDRLAQSLGVVKNMAIKRVIDSHPEGAKLDRISADAKTRKGKPGVVFAHSRAAVAQIEARLKADGHRVVTLTGSDSSSDKERKKLAFNPENGARTADIIVCSDAGATGANLQSGRWLVNYDTSDTAMNHAQRRGRIDRIGQKNAIELMDYVGDHPSEHKARRRLADKYELRDLMASPLETIDDRGIAAFLHKRQLAEDQNSLF